METSSNVKWEGGNPSRESWELINGHLAGVYWLTGLSGSGKSTIAKKVADRLFASKARVVLLDGDNMRHGLCGDLGFSDEDRAENIRRVGHVAKMMFDQGNIVICTFISPFVDDREMVKDLIGDDNFYEIYVKCDVELCAIRDPKGLYKKVEAGEIPNFTGVTSPYEEPQDPFMTIHTAGMTPDESADMVMVGIEESLLTFQFMDQFDTGMVNI